MFSRLFWPKAFFTPLHWPGGLWRGADALRVYLTGAGSDGGAQADPDLSLGGYRSSTEAQRVGVRVVAGLPGLRIGAAARRNGVTSAVGSVDAVDIGIVRYTAPGSTTPGNGVALANGAEATLTDGADESQWVRVTRNSSRDLAGAANLRFTEVFNNAVGMADRANVSAVALTPDHRGLAIAAIGADALEDVTAWLAPLGTAATSSAAQLAGSGAGTISGAADCFADWPHKGACRIKTSGGAWRETVYYSRRTDNDLTVPSTGRALLGSSAAAGAATDVCEPVPLARIGIEEPDPLNAGDVQTLAGSGSTPTAVTFVSPVTQATGVDLGTIAAGTRHVVLWLRRELPPACGAWPRYPIQIELAFSILGAEFRETLAGWHRVSDSTLDRYELHVGVGGPPDLDDTPDDTGAAIADLSAALAPDEVYHLVTNKRNAWDQVSRSLAATVIALDGDGDEIHPPPSIPEFQELTATAGGKVLVEAVYWHHLDHGPADQWLIYKSTTGVPVPGVDTPTVVTMERSDAATFLEWESGAHSNGANVRVLLRVRRSSDTVDSESTAVQSVTASTSTPDAPTGGVWHGFLAEQTQ